MDIQDFLLATTASGLNNSEVADLIEILEIANINISMEEIEKCFIDVLN
jgi:hypothetical protein